MNAVNWIVAQTQADPEVVPCGAFATPEGRLSVVDPLCATEARFVGVPTSGGRLTVLADDDGYWSQLIVGFSDADVQGGTYEFDCPVDGGVTSPVTPASLAALNAFRATLPTSYPSDCPNHRYPAPNLYIEHFEQYDEEEAEPLTATLPDGTAMPYIHSGYGDGGYPVFTLTDKEGSLCAVYCDFMGCEKTDNWVMPPGVTMT